MKFPDFEGEICGRHWRKQQDPGRETREFAPRVSCTATFAMLGVTGARRQLGGVDGSGRGCLMFILEHFGTLTLVNIGGDQNVSRRRVVQICGFKMVTLELWFSYPLVNSQFAIENGL